MVQSMSDVNSKTRRLWKAKLLSHSNGLCPECDLPLNGDVTFDHIIAKAMGGRTALENLQLVHRLCNERKGTEMNKRLMKGENIYAQ